MEYVDPALESNKPAEERLVDGLSIISGSIQISTKRPASLWLQVRGRGTMDHRKYCGLSFRIAGGCE